MNLALYIQQTANTLSSIIWQPYVVITAIKIYLIYIEKLLNKKRSFLMLNKGPGGRGTISRSHMG